LHDWILKVVEEERAEDRGNASFKFSAASRKEKEEPAVVVDVVSKAFRCKKKGSKKKNGEEGKRGRKRSGVAP